MSISSIPKQQANELISDVTRTALNDIISHAQIILHDLNEGKINVDNFLEYSDKQTGAGLTLMSIIAANIKTGIEYIETGECHCNQCQSTYKGDSNEKL